MNSSTASCASWSEYCSGGDFMKYDEADRIGPPMPRSRAIFAARTASMMTPAEFGESQTSSLSSGVQRGVAEGAALQADVGPLAVVEPRHVVRRADVHVAPCAISCGICEVTDWVLEIFFDTRRLRSSMFMKSMLPPKLSWYVRSSSTPRSSNSFASTRCTMVAPTWRLDVVADDRQAGVGELLRPLRVGGDEDRQRVDEGAAGVDRGLGVELVGLLRADRQVGDDARRPGRRAAPATTSTGGLVGLLDRSRGSTRPRPSKVGPRCTVTPVGGTSQILMVLFSLATIASARSLPDLLGVHVERGDELARRETW